jgi:valyl-tRNA synthetase
VKIRNVRAEYNVDPGRRIQAIADGGSHTALIEHHTDLFSRLCNVERVDLLNGNAPGQSAAVVSGDVTIHLPLAEMIDLSAERERLTKELEGVKVQIAKTEGMLANESFVSRAKPEIVENTRTKLAELIRSRDGIEG